MKEFSFVAALTVLIQIVAAQNVTINIKKFGAKGDGKTNDHTAFVKAAAFFNKRGGNGKLIIPEGTYIIGLQVSDGENAYLRGVDAFRFDNVNNLEIAGETGTIIKYTDSLKYGSFNPATGEKIAPTSFYVHYPNLAYIGHTFYLNNCSNITIHNIEINGNSKGIIKGGMFGDAGIQAPHYGVFIADCKNILIENLYIHDMALDGISVANHTPQGYDTPDQNITISSSSFKYNGRQGLSWIGGIGLKVLNTYFDFTGKGSISSPPGAGLDIEAEVGKISKGIFQNCTFNNNKGCGMVADNGDSRGIKFINCEFTGATNWSAWVKKPDYTFQSCTFYGSFVHGFEAETDQDATKFFDCNFFDVKNGQEMFGRFLFESNNAKRLTLIQCTFTSVLKKICWIEGNSKWKADEYYKIQDTKFVIKNTNLKKEDFVGVIRVAALKNNTYQFTKFAKTELYWMNECCNKINRDLGGNKISFE